MKKYTVYGEDLDTLSERMDRIVKKQNLENYKSKPNLFTHLNKQQLLAMVWEYEHLLGLVQQEEQEEVQCIICGNRNRDEVITTTLEFEGSQFDDHKTHVDICKTCKPKNLF